MIQLKSDPDGTPEIANTSGSSQIDCPANSPLPPLDSTVLTHSLRTALNISPDDHQSVRLKANRSLRPIAPKPSTFSPPSSEPSTTSNSIPIIPRNRYGPASMVTDEIGFVSFGGFERHFVPSQRHLRVPRAEYANAIVPHKHLNVFGRNTLRLYQIVPKSRTMGFSATNEKVVAPHQIHSTFCRTQPDDMVPQSNLTGWNCSHQTIRSKHADLNTPNQVVKPETSNSPTDPVAVSFQGDQSVSQSALNPTDSSSNFVLNVNRLRPSVQLLTRIGRQLVRSQYKYLTTDECGCGAVRHLSDSCVDHDEDRISDDIESDTSETLLAECESSHLVWRKKAANARWNRVRALCESHKCPFIPATIFQLHRHLEQGHQKLVRYPLRFKRKITSSGPELSCDFAIPLVVIPHARIPARIGCPVCPDFKGPPNSVISHISQAHPFISASLLCKPFRLYCGICGVVISNSSACRVSASGSCVHIACQAASTSTRHAAWANFDAHPLACLMLNPNRHSRLSMPELMVRHLYQSMDYVLSINVGRLHLWTIDSCSLRCSLAVSSLFGELIRVPLSKRSTLASRAETPESNFSNAEASHAITNDSIESDNSVEAPASSFVTVSSPISTVITRVQEQSLPSHPVFEPSTPEAEVLTQKPGPEFLSARKRAHNSSESTSLESIEPKKKNARTSEIEVVQPLLNRNEPDQTIMVDLTNGHEDVSKKDRTERISSVQLTPPKTTEGSLSHPSSLRIFGKMDKPVSKRLIRMSRTMKEACELCNLCVRSSRQHLLESHNREVGLTPTQFCLCCGRLFWTDEGCDNHQNLKCAVCSKEVCHATMFMHLGAEHRDYFLRLLEVRPLVCPVCHSKFPKLPLFLSHALIMHQCLLPREVYDDFTQRLPDFDIHPSLRGASLNHLTQLHTQCKQSIRKRNVAPVLVPSNIVSYDASCLKLPIYSCSVCSSAFVSVTHLDFHVMLIGHQYWCASCSFACLNAADLIAHNSASHVSKTINHAQFRLIRPPGSTNGMPPMSKLISSMAGSAFTPSVSTGLRQPQPAVAGQLHSCTLCPVFCLTLEDLNLHRLTAHKYHPLTNQPKGGPLISASFISSSSTAPTTVLVTSCADPVSSTVLHYRPPLNDGSSQRPRLLYSNTNPGGLNALVGLRPSILARPSTSVVQPTFTISLRPPSVSSSTSSLVLPAASPDADDLTCPVCEFQSKNRSEVMQHIVDAH